MTEHQDEDGGRSASWLEQFAEDLKEAREAAGLSVRELAGQTSYSYQQVSNVENRQRTPSEAFSREVDAAFGTGTRFQRLHARLLLDQYPVWFRSAAREESRATRIKTYQCQVVHGLLQVEEYARELMREARPRESHEKIDADVTARMNRQTVLTSPTPPLLWMVLDENFLRRPIGSPEIMTAQLNRLLEESDSPHTVIQILEYSAGAHPGLSGSFTLLSYADRDDVMYVEGLRTSQLVQDQDSVQRAHLTYDLLLAAASSRDRTRDLIRSAVKDYQR
ncbi:helix-turn-helix domain-containing protein [Actinacidiphila alni]|uniref:helix-turn-helix domain-containing protein n=1 Tax=Actinacidiphila alni TaxID=380248 RepID=UPI0034549405